MKQVLITALAVLSLFGCKDDDSKFKGDNSPIYINGKEQTNKAANKQRLSVHEMCVQGNLHLNGDLSDNSSFGCGFGNWDCYDCDEYYRTNIDTINDRLIMQAINVISNERMNEWGGEFLRARNYIITHWHTGDTLAYIPNSVIRQGQAEILDLWVKGDIPEIYRRFNDLFFFTPCTGEEFLAQKEKIDWAHEFDNIPEHAETHKIRWDGDWNGASDPNTRSWFY